MSVSFETRREPSQRYRIFPHRRDELPYRLRQQSLLGEFALTAMQTRDHRHILQQATEFSARGLGDGFAKVLEYLPIKNA